MVTAQKLEGIPSMLHNVLTRREALHQTVALLGTASVAGSLFANPPGENAREQTHWPMYQGPLGNSCVPAPSERLHEDLNRATRIWDSQENDLPVGKLLSSGNPFTRPSGGMSGLIKGGETIFFAYFQPGGEVSAANWVRRGVPADRLISADDVVLAVNATNGRTLWKTVREDRGVNHAPTKRGGWAVTPAYHSGRVFSLGTTGRLYALDATNGRLLWEQNIGPFHQRMEAMKRQALAQRRMGSWTPMRCSLTVAGGVVVVPDYVGSRDTGLAGYDVQTGRRLWHRAAATFNMAAPAVWHHEGREYLLAGTYSGHLRLLDPTNGRVLWEVADLGPQEEQLAPGTDQVIVNVKAGDDRETPKLYGAYRLHPERAERVWTMPDRSEFHAERGGDGAAYRRVSVVGNQFVIYRNYRPNRNERITGLWLVSPENGRILNTMPIERGGWTNVFHPVGDRQLLWVHDASHHNPSFSLIRLQDNRLTALGQTWDPTNRNEGTSAYEVPMPYPIPDGRMYLRTSVGVIRAFDLRQSTE